jgi:hypothetical protein
MGKYSGFRALALGAVVLMLAACQASGTTTGGGTTGAPRGGSPTTGSSTDSSVDRAAGTGLGATTVPGVAGSGARTVNLSAQNNFGLTGRATLTDAGNQTMVQLTITGSDDVHPAHIHNGTCANLDPTPLYPLADVRGGLSSTTVPASLADITSGQKAINVHRSPSDIATYVACGDIR